MYYSFDKLNVAEISFYLIVQLLMRNLLYQNPASFLYIISALDESM